MTFLEIFLPLISSFMMVITISSIDPKKSIKRPAVAGRTLGDNRQAVIDFPDPVYNLAESLRKLVLDEIELRFYYVPANECTKKFMGLFDNELQSHQPMKNVNWSVEYSAMDYPEQLDSQFVKVKSNKTVMIGLIFHNTCDNDYKSFLKNFTVTIRALGPVAIRFQSLFPDKLTIGGPSSDLIYIDHLISQSFFIEKGAGEFIYSLFLYGFS